jgi:undecaprenyl-diphosphatase
MSRIWRKLVERWGEADHIMLLTALLILAAVWVFTWVAIRVSAGSTQKLDDRILLALRDPANPARTIGPLWLEEVGRDLTALGGVAALSLVTLAISGYLIIGRNFRALTLLLIATLGGLLLSTLLKDFFYRPRPEVVPHLSQVMTTSFPSGHSMLSAVVYLTLGSMLASLAERRRLKLYFLSVAMLLTFSVGISRVYMGVHYPTDVLAGWSAGLAWALLCSLVARAQTARPIDSGTGD